MKPRTLLLVILSIAAAIEILVVIVFDALGLKGGIGTAALAVVVSAAASAVPLYMVAVRPSARLEEERRELSRKGEVRDLLIGIDTVAMETNDPDLVLGKAAEDMRRVLQVPRCTFWLFGTPDSVVEHREAGLAPAATHFPLRESPELLEEAWRTGKCTVVDDVRKAQAYWPVADEMERFGARSFLIASLSLPDGPVGFLFLCRPEPHSWGAGTVAAADAVAWQIGTVLQHTTELRNREEVTASLLSLLDHVPGLVYRGQRDWTMSIVSAGVERMTGYSPQDFLSGAVSWKNLVHPEDLLTVKLAFRSAVAKSQKVLRVEYRARHRDGSYRWLADRRRLIYDEAGHFLFVDGLCLDITDRKRIEAAKLAVEATAGVRP